MSWERRGKGRNLEGSPAFLNFIFVFLCGAIKGVGEIGTVGCREGRRMMGPRGSGRRPRGGLVGGPSFDLFAASRSPFSSG